MADLLANALLIARFMYEHSLIGTKRMTVAGLKENLGLHSEEFDDADVYLLGVGYIVGTMGGDMGFRSLAPAGVEFATKGERKTDEEYSSALQVDASNEPEVAHVLFLDLVGYSKLPMRHQVEVLHQLKEIVGGLESVRRNRKNSRLTILPTGDGMALVFFGGATPHVDAAKELHQALIDNTQIVLRAGLHSGPVHRIIDINGNPNVSGAGINLAQRIMDCGDAGHILLSNAVASTLLELGGWEDALEDLGAAEVKHGLHLHVFNLRGEDFGNGVRPSKLTNKIEEGATSGSTNAQADELLTSRGNIRSAICAELDENLDLLRSVWGPVLEAYRRFRYADNIKRAQKGDAIRRIALPKWKLEKWQSLLPQVVQELTPDEFKGVDRFYSRLAKLTDLRDGDTKRWQIEGEIIISDLIAEGNPLRRN